MTRQQYLLTKLAEECSEVAQRALKAAHFGPGEIQPGQPMTNAERLHQEFCDLIGVAYMLTHEFGIELLRWSHAEIEAKRIKVDKYMALAQSLGMVEDGGPY